MWACPVNLLQKTCRKSQHELTGVIEGQTEKPILVLLFYEFVPGDKYIWKVETEGSSRDQYPSWNPEGGLPENRPGSDYHHSDYHDIYQHRNKHWLQMRTKPQKNRSTHTQEDEEPYWNPMGDLGERWKTKDIKDMPDQESKQSHLKRTFPG